MTSATSERPFEQVAASLSRGGTYGLTGLTVLTGDGTTLKKAALVVEQDKIKDLGPTDEVKKRHGAVTFYDGSRYLACPGLVNAHVHCPMGFFRGLGHGQDEMIETFLFPAEKSLTEELLEPLSYSYLYQTLRSGVTTVGEHYYFVRGVGHAIDRIGMRGVIGETIADLGGAFPGTAAWDQWKKTIDSWPHSARVTPSVAPHAADTVSPKLLKDLAAFSKSRKLPLHMHLSQTEGERDRVEKREGMSPVAYADSCGALSERTLAVHLVSTDLADILRLKDKGVTAGVCPASQIIYEKLTPLAELLRTGVPLAVGTDCAASNDGADLLAELKLLALLAQDRGVPASLREPHDLLAMGTANGAAALGLGAVTGKLAKGLKADFVLLRRDLATEPMPRPDVNLIFSFSSRHVDHVVIDGKVVLASGRLTQVSEDDLTREYEKAVAEISRRLQR